MTRVGKAEFSFLCEIPDVIHCLLEELLVTVEEKTKHGQGTDTKFPSTANHTVEILSSEEFMLKYYDFL